MTAPYFSSDYWLFWNSNTFKDLLR